jgi:hypothetical protein
MEPIPSGEQVCVSKGLSEEEVAASVVMKIPPQPCDTRTGALPPPSLLSNKVDLGLAPNPVVNLGERLSIVRQWGASEEAFSSETKFVVIIPIGKLHTTVGCFVDLDAAIRFRDAVSLAPKEFIATTGRSGQFSQAYELPSSWMPFYCNMARPHIKSSHSVQAYAEPAKAMVLRVGQHHDFMDVIDDLRARGWSESDIWWGYVWGRLKGVFDHENFDNISPAANDSPAEQAEFPSPPNSKTHPPSKEGAPHLSASQPKPRSHQELRSEAKQEKRELFIRQLSDLADAICDRSCGYQALISTYRARNNCWGILLDRCSGKIGP